MTPVPRFVAMMSEDYITHAVAAVPLRYACAVCIAPRVQRVA